MEASAFPLLLLLLQCVPALQHHTTLTPHTHTDFLLPASREAIVQDSPWNLELKDRIPHLLLLALDKLSQLPVPGRSLGQEELYCARLNFWLTCLPLRGVAKASASGVCKAE